ncbi:MAG: EamA family transporter [Burkholderiales bacterium]|nr:EamA family transporter [Burkholderiales bacterium]
MDGWPLVAALTSALLHAAWNAAVKAHPAPREAMAAQMTGAALLAALGLVATGLPPPAAWPWIAASTTLNVCAVLALLRAYELGGFGTVYPVMRAIGVLGVAAVAPFALGERLGPGAMLGVGLIVAALLLLTRDAHGVVGAQAGAQAADFPPKALAWTALAGVITSGYVLADAQGARSGGAGVGAAAGPLAYGLAVSVSNALAMSWVSRAAGAPWALLARHWRLVLPVSSASMLSYLLILWVFTRAPVAPAAALRDTSAVFAMLIAVVWLKERLRPRRWLALALVIAGVPLLRLG